MKPYIDLHLHTDYSDGLDSPAELLDLVRDKQLAAFSVCDHDSFDAWFEIHDLLTESDPELITGVELSAKKNDEDIHILGYFFDPFNQKLKSAVSDFREKRNRRAAKMLNELRKLGIDISMDLLLEIAGDSSVGRPHVADAMVRVGAINNYNEAFRKYIGTGGPAYVPKDTLSPSKAIALIKDAGGLAFLAHPGINDAGRHIDEFADYGLDGIEVYHSHHNYSHRKHYREVARKKNLLISGGSDYHGRNSDIHGMLGSQNVPVDILKTIKDHLKHKV